MKFNLTKGIVTLTSETQEEALALFSIATKTEEKKAPKKVTEEKPRKRHVHTKICDLCGANCKGAQGLGVHKRFAHQIKSAGAEANSAYYAKIKSAKNEGGLLNAERQFTGIWK